MHPLFHYRADMVLTRPYTSSSHFLRPLAKWKRQAGLIMKIPIYCLRWIERACNKNETRYCFLLGDATSYIIRETVHTDKLPTHGKLVIHQQGCIFNVVFLTRDNICDMWFMEAKVNKYEIQIQAKLWSKIKEIHKKIDIIKMCNFVTE